MRVQPVQQDDQGAVHVRHLFCMVEWQMMLRIGGGGWGGIQLPCYVGITS